MPKPNSLDPDNILSKSKDLCKRSKALQNQCKVLHEKCDTLSARSDTVLAISKLIFEFTNDSIIKQCSCGATYRPSTWYKLILVGYQYEVPGLKGEMRNCAFCNSTLFFVSYRRKK